MKFTPVDPPRVFVVGRDGSICLKDIGRIELAADEQVTFISASGSEYDVVRKIWGYYATPSLNNRLPSFGLRPALVKNRSGRYYVLLVEREQMAEFERYIVRDNQTVVAWLDDEKTLKALEQIGDRGDERG